MALDTAGTTWIANFRGNSLSAFAAPIAGTSAPLSPAIGLGLDAALNQPFGTAIDASGNLWISNFAGSTLTAFIGLAAPVRTPLLGLPTPP